MCRRNAPVPLETPELADIVRGCLDTYPHSLTGVQARALRAIADCRSARLGGHLHRCDACGAEVPLYNSCRNRHCPKCQRLAGARWVEARMAELLPVPYFHLVFTLPHTLNPLAQGNPALMYGLLFQAASASLLQFARDPRWLGAEPAISMVLHTWGQNLGQHLHVHCVVSGGGLSADGQWVETRRGFFAPVKALSKVFRGKFLAAFRRARNDLRFAGGTAPLADPREFQKLLDELYAKDWVVYAKRPFAGPQTVLKYLSRYTHRVAISNARILGYGGQQVRFRYKDYRDHNQSKIMSLAAHEFLRRFLLHILPHGFMRIRHYGLLANRVKADKLGQCRTLLHQPEAQQPESAQAPLPCPDDLPLCPVCRKGRLHPFAPLPKPAATGPPGVSP